MLYNINDSLEWYNISAKNDKKLCERGNEMKKIIALLLALVMVFALCACGKTDSASGDKTVVGLVVAGAFGDRSFYDSSKEGVDKLASEFSNVEVKTIECNNENHDAQMRNAADVSNIVVCVGWEFYNIETIAPEYPNVHWIWIDNATSAPVENVLNITYAQNEGSVGAVGGEDSDTINDFIVGYKQGAEYYAAEKGGSVKVETNYSNDYDDPAKGKECAKALHDLGADVIFQIASKAGDGVFEVGTSIYEAIKAYLNGDTSLWGTTWIADMSNGYVGIGYGEEGATQQVPDEVKAEVEALAAKIVSGEIKVDTTRG